jgi:hypothetical protein
MWLKKKHDECVARSRHGFKTKSGIFLGKINAKISSLERFIGLIPVRKKENSIFLKLVQS